ncbi:hypothetical protein [Mycolicibacterium moriokaense]|uniref:Uncharacterized protein n=1 Tax=Mycolicibacterium moriokaense TaxID=39691 RepID=A0A318HD98_9MYCO|nr:hypothetical protein [Mycolicibacterium moriokaense]PXX06330.1 hypothetical protein C8E89_114103 [Mycolicibacterium moriokaense]
MTGVSTDEIDRELASRTDEVAAMSATMIELDNHPGLEHVRRCPPTGVTAQRWAVIERSLALLWEDLGRATSILDSAQAIRARRSKPADSDRAELTRLLSERALEVSRQAVPLAQRRITDPAEMVEYVGLADIVERMRVAYPAVAAFFDAVDEIDSLIAKGLAPSQRRLDEVGATGPKEIVELLRMSATDPLSLTNDAVEERIWVIADGVERRSAELAELAALQANWSDALATTAVQLDALGEATRQAAQVRIYAEQTVVAGPLPMHSDTEPALRAELEVVATGSIGPPVPAALLSLQRRIDAALRFVSEDERLAQGLLDRRRELKGRLTVYQAKAARLGLGEDSNLLASGRIADGLLSRRPCDLRALTRAVTDFQQMVVEKQGKTR